VVWSTTAKVYPNHDQTKKRPAEDSKRDRGKAQPPGPNQSCEGDDGYPMNYCNKMQQTTQQRCKEIIEAYI
jgi:hypothetical protein